MRILQILEQDVALRSSIRNAAIDFSQMTASACAVVTDVERDGRQVIGYGFSSNGRYAQGGILRQRLLPRVLDAAPERLLDATGANLDPLAVHAVAMTNEKPGGHGERSAALGALDMAVWDVVAKVEGAPLYRLLAERFRNGRAEPTVEAYAAGGYYYPGKGERALQEELRSYLERGYTCVKIKVGGAPLADDLRRIEAALEVLDGDGARLAVDANARFDLSQALEFSAAIAAYGLRWYEEPCDPLDYGTLAEVAAASPTPLATGENLFSAVDVRNLLRYGGLDPRRDTLQMDPALSYGLVEYLRVLDELERCGWSPRRCVPHGGHQLALHVAAGLGLGGVESYPDVFAPFNGYSDGTPVVDGRVAPSQSPGIGLEQNADLWAALSALTGQAR
jgi:L-alanine-DL-glutamate epimerase-like enolase superfamily enzyme